MLSRYAVHRGEDRCLLHVVLTRTQGMSDTIADDVSRQRQKIVPEKIIDTISQLVDLSIWKTDLDEH